MRWSYERRKKAEDKRHKKALKDIRAIAKRAKANDKKWAKKG